jgi:hypothetical protein
MQIMKFMFIVLLLSTICFSIEPDTSRFKFSGWGYFTTGRIEQATPAINNADAFKDVSFDKVWLTDFDAGLKSVASFGENGRARFHFGLTTAYVIQDFGGQRSAESSRRKFVPYLIDAAIENTIKSGKNSFFGEFGFFPVKYNPQAMNLGEYLFRSGTYPQYINSGFELADKEKLTGLHGCFKHTINENSNLKADVYFTNDMRDFPVHDFSLSYILAANTKFIQASAGVSHAHLIVTDDRATTPANDTLTFRKNSVPWYNVVAIDSTVTGDTITYDTTDLTFRGTKIMARFTVDMKALFNSSVFGESDLKIYCEGAFLGVKNYPIWYEKPFERMPIMFGINLPAFKVLDVLSVEVEHYASPYINTAENAWRFRSPAPFTGVVGRSDYVDVVSKTDDDWKWSIYASKRFGRIRFSTQFASDHLLKTPYYLGPPANAKYTEICERTQDWYWMSRVMFSF